MEAFILIVSVGLQFTAAVGALRLARFTGRSPAWTALAAAIGLMGVRRAITLGRLLTGDPTSPVDLAAETVALLISILVVIAVAFLGPLIKRLQRAEEILQMNEQLRQEADRRAQAQQALEQQQRTLGRLLQASDHERRLIGYDIHDGLAQQLAGAMMHLQAYEVQRHTAPEQADRAYGTAVDLVQQAHAEARRLISGVRPPALDVSGLQAALAGLIDDLGPPKGPHIELHADVQCGRLPAVLENAVYRVAQEALANACRHSGTDRVAVTLTQQDGTLRLEVRDWGTGFDPESVPDDRFGLEGIRQRAQLLGGELTVDSAPGKGSTVSVTLPIIHRALDLGVN